ncbi:hypothetical protein AVEN_8026-1, partial [Araneus ventricosus]
CTSSQLSQSPSQIFISKAVDGHHSAFLTGRAIIFPKSKREHRIVEKTRIQHRGHFFQVQQGTGLLRRRASNTVVISSKSNRAQDYRERRASKRMSQDLHQTLSLHPTVVFDGSGTGSGWTDWGGWTGSLLNGWFRFAVCGCGLDDGHDKAGWLELAGAR